MWNNDNSQEILNTLKFMRSELETTHIAHDFLSFSSELSKFNRFLLKLEKRELIIVDTNILKKNLQYEEKDCKLMGMQNVHKINAYIKVGAEANLDENLLKNEDFVKETKERLYYRLLSVLEV